MTLDIPAAMSAVLLTGHGGFETLVYRDDIEIPVPGPGDVLIKVAVAGVNNTDINTRTAWYFKRVSGGTGPGGAGGFESAEASDGSWSGTPLSFPRIQGADCCGQIVAVGDGVDAGRLGERVLVQTMLRSPVDFRPYECWTFGSECDGGFAQYAKAPSCETHKVDCNWSDPELASILCAYSTAENLLARSNVTASDRVLITGASGGVGSAAVQLAKRRGARVIAGPLVELDVRTLYLKDLSLFGCTFQEDHVFKDLIGYIERGEIRPVVARTYPLRDIVQAQMDFLTKRFTGKLVLIPPA